MLSFTLLRITYSCWDKNLSMLVNETPTVLSNYSLDAHQRVHESFALMSLRAIKLPWIFPGAPLILNGAPGNIQTSTGVVPFCRHAPQQKLHCTYVLNNRIGLSWKCSVMSGVKKSEFITPWWTQSMQTEDKWCPHFGQFSLISHANYDPTQTMCLL